MKTIKRAAMLVGLSIALAGMAAPSLGDDAAEISVIQAVDKTFQKSYNSGDVDTIAGLYAENAILQPPGAPRAVGKAAVKSYFTGELPGFAKAGLKLELSGKQEGGVSGDLGWASGTYIIRDKSGQSIETGKYLSVSKKVGGKWLYIRDTWNADAAPPAPAPAPASAPKK
jgi:ketosteroid isomerase-like protein